MPVTDEKPAGACTCGSHCISVRRTHPDKASSSKCVPQAMNDPGELCQAPEAVVRNTVVPYAVFCLCHCQPLLTGVTSNSLEQPDPCIDMSKEEMLLAGDGNGNCNDPHLPTQVEQDGGLDLDRLKAMQAKAKADAENAKNSNAPSKLQRKLLADARKAVENAKYQYEEAAIARSNSDFLRDKAVNGVGR